MLGEPKDPEQGPTSWADVVAASNTAEEAAPVEAAPPSPAKVEPGDTVRHPKFGDCTIHRITENYQFVHMAVPNGKVRRLSLDIVEFHFEGIEAGRRIFTTRVKKR